MKPRHVFAVLAICLLITGCFGGRTQWEKTDEELARSQVEKFLNGFNQTDAAAMGSVLAPIVTLTTITGEEDDQPYSREEFMGRLQETFCSPKDSPADLIPLTYGTFKTVAAGEGIIIHVNVLKADNTLVDTWKFTLVKNKNEWQIRNWGANAPPLKTPMGTSDKSSIKISIDWSELNRLVSGTATNEDIDCIGVRLVYSNRNATFTQSISRTGTHTNSILTLDALACNQAHMYLVAVNTKSQAAFSYAVAENLRLAANSVLSMTTNDFQWIDAIWVIEDDFVSSIQTQHFELPRDETEVMVHIKVRDPFQEGKRASYETSLIDCLGKSSMRENVDGWLHFDAFLENPNPGKANTSRYWLQPSIDGVQFNLGNKGFYIPPVICDIRITWK